MYGIDLSVQFENLMPSLGLGFILAFLYDIMIFFRKTILTGKVAYFLTDMFFVILCTVSSVLLFIAVNSGHIRLYLIVAEILAATVYRLTAGRLVMSVSDRISSVIKKFANVVFAPLRLVKGLLVNAAVKIEEKFMKMLKNLKINSKNPLKDSSEL